MTIGGDTSSWSVRHLYIVIISALQQHAVLLCTSIFVHEWHHFFKTQVLNRNLCRHELDKVEAHASTRCELSSWVSDTGHESSSDEVSSHKDVAMSWISLTPPVAKYLIIRVKSRPGQRLSMKNGIYDSCVTVFRKDVGRAFGRNFEPEAKGGTAEPWNDVMF